METLSVVTQHNSSKSTRKAQRQLGISFHSVQQGLHSNLHLFSCDIMILCELAQHDREQSLHFAM